ncbi:unnamed protein product, partial [Dibothriocephalus latus]
MPTAQDSDIYGVVNTCIMSLMDTSMKNSEKFKATVVDLNKYTDELQNNRRSFYNDKSIYDTKTLFNAIGLEFIELFVTTAAMESSDSKTAHVNPTTDKADVDDWADITSPMGPRDSNSDAKNGTNAVVKARVLNFLLEVWLFEQINLDKAGHFK